MKNLVVILLSVLMFGSVNAQVELEPNIKKVTVFSLGAEVTHEFNIKIGTGQNVLVLKDVSPHLVKGTIQIPSEDVTVINSTLVKKLSDPEVMRLRDEINSYEKQLAALDKSLTNDANIMTADNFSRLLNIYDERTRSLKEQLREAKRVLKKDETHSGVTYLEILVSTQKPVNQKITLKYVVGSAAWVPEYEVFVPSINEDLKLKYIAKIMNKTGEDWNNVDLTLSLNSPFDKAGEMPKMEPIYYNSSRYNENDDQEGDFSKSQRLEELKIEGVEYIEYDAPPYTDLIKVGNKKSIPANGGIYSYDVFTTSLKTKYAWYAYPSREEHPFLVGQVVNWDTLPLIDGEIKVFLNGTNIGDSYLSLDGLPDTLDIPIGQNQEVLVEREVIGNETFKKESGNKVRMTYAYSYKIKSNTSNDVRLRVFDQVPVSQSSNIEVTMINHSTGTYDDEQGLVTWNFDLDPKAEIKNTKLSYSVEYNRNKVSNSFYRQNYSWVQKKGTQRKVRAKF